MRGNRRERAQPLASAASSSRREVAQHEEPRAGLAAELAALPDLSRDALKERWKELYGAPPPSHLGRPILLHAIAYRIQEQALGGLDPATRRLLDRAAQDLARGREPSVPPQPIPSGTRLLREWQGVVHEVIVRVRIESLIDEALRDDASRANPISLAQMNCDRRTGIDSDPGFEVKRQHLLRMAANEFTSRRDRFAYVYEWNEESPPASQGLVRGVRGGSFVTPADEG